MANFFTQHHFSPRWSTSSHHDAPAEHLTPKSTNGQTPSHHTNNSHQNNHPDNRAHPSHMHDAVSRFLQALNFHYGPDDYEMANPHFDMVETKNCYAVYGELPGLSQKDIAVEANDHLFTLTISGELKRPIPKEVPEAIAATFADSEGVGIAHLTKGKEPEPEPETAETAAEPAPDASNTSKAAPPAEVEAGPSEQQEQPKPSTETEATAAPSTPKPAENGNGAKADHKPHEKTTHWHVKERRVGHFKRVFRFPVEFVEMANIKANIHHGLLCVIVPKRNDLESYNRKVEENRKVSVDTFISGPDHTTNSVPIVRLFLLGP
ncbi:hypothetical protein V8F20_006844 [Naviculisporaceae sp. PSN 640]